MLADRGRIDPAIPETMYTTFLASAFRSIRFGITEAHGLGVAVQLNAYLDAQAVTRGARRPFSVDRRRRGRRGDGADGRDSSTIQARGDYDAAKALLARLGTVRSDVRTVLERLTDVPVDIEPTFTTAFALR